MTEPTPRAWNVVLSFAPPGPLYSTLTLAPDKESAVALATLALMSNTPTDAPLHAVLVTDIPAETLRHMLRACEGRLPDGGSAEVMRLVSPLGDSEIARSLLVRTGYHLGQNLPDDGPAAA